MVYLENKTELQELWIPRNDGQGVPYNPTKELEGVDVTISQDITVVHPSSGYYGMSAVTIDATEYGQQNYDSGFDDGYIDGYASGSTEGYESGYTSGYTSGSTDGYNSGYTSGETHQKSLLVSTAITQNGSYQRENGYSAITVNVPTGQTYNIEQNKPFTATSNGDYTITPSSGQTTMRTGYEDGVDFYFTASTYPSVGYFEIGTIEFYNRDDESIGSVDIYYDNGQIGYDNSDWDENIYHNKSGNNILYVGFDEDDYSDYVWREGEDFSFNYDVMSAVSLNVNVPQTGHTDQELQDAYNSGYTSGSTDGFNSGYTSGETHQKSLLVSTAITQNGTYTRENGYSAITVNVPQTGSTNSIISVTGNTWYELDHQFTTGEKIEITNATFDYSFASPARHQQLIAGGGGEWIRIGGNRDNLYTSYYGDNKITCGPIVLDDDHILLTNGAFYINDMETPVSTFGPYQTGITKGSNMVVFANSAEGSDSVCGQTASVGVITIYDENDNVVDKYIPELHNGVACFHNIISGNYITPSGTGTPTITSTDYSEGYNDGRQDVINTFTSTTVTTNGVYGSSAHPLSSITVNVPQSGGSGTTKIFFADYIHTDTLQADSTNRIDTGIYPTTATTFRVKGLGKGLSSGYELAGFDLEDAGEDYDYRLFCYSTSGEILGFDWYSERITNENWGGLTDGKNIDFTCSNYQVYDNINETVLISGNPQSNMSQNIPIYVNVASWWLKGLEIWEGSTKVFDGVAAYDENGTVGLYDSVSNSLVTNTGLTIVYENVDEYQNGYNDGQNSIINTFSSMTATTNGVYGTSAHPLSSITVNVPQTGGSGVKYIEYLETDGTNIVYDTGINITSNNVKIYLDYMRLSGSTENYLNIVSQVYNDRKFSYAFFVPGNWNTRGGVMPRFGGENYEIPSLLDTYYETVVSNTGTTINGVDYPFSFTSFQETDEHMYLNAQHYYGNFRRFAIARYYRFAVESGGTLLVDLRPALDENNIPCFYDEVSETYIYHTGTGTPTAGPVLDPSYASGYTDGQNSIINTFTAMTATTNGVYGSSAHPLSSITVNVTQSGGSVTYVDWISNDPLSDVPLFSDLTQYIDLGVTPDYTTKFRVKGYYQNRPNGLNVVGNNPSSWAGDRADYIYSLFWYAGSNGKLYLDFDDNSRLIDDTFGSHISGDFLDYTVENNSVYDNVAEQYLVSGSPVSEFYSTWNMVLDVQTWRPQSIEIWKGNTKVFDGKAAVDGEKVGLFDSISQTMVYNSALTMTYGNALPSPDYQSGYTSGYTDGYSSGYTSGVTDGENNIVSTFSSMTATTNGVYGSSAHPYSSVTVNVPSVSPVLERKEKRLYGDSFTGQGEYSYFEVKPSSGYDGLSSVIVKDITYGKVKYNSGYTSGYTDGYDSGFTSGYSSGYSSGYTDGEVSSSAWQDGYDSGYSSGFTSGFTSGSTYEKNKLSAITITANTTTTVNDGGYSAITVNVPPPTYMLLAPDRSIGFSDTVIIGDGTRLKMKFKKNNSGYTGNNVSIVGAQQHFQTGYIYGGIAIGRNWIGYLSSSSTLKVSTAFTFSDVTDYDWEDYSITASTMGSQIKLEVERNGVYTANTFSVSTAFQTSPDAHYFGINYYNATGGDTNYVRLAFDSFYSYNISSIGGNDGTLRSSVVFRDLYKFI